MNDQTESLADAVRHAARGVSLEWSEIIDRADLEQEIWVRLLKDKYAEKVAGMDPPARRKTLRMIGSQVASDMRVDYEHFSGQYAYSTGEVRDRLNRQPSPLDHPEVVAADPGEYGTDEFTESASSFSVEDVDLRTAFGQLEEHHRNALRLRFVGGELTDTSSGRGQVLRAVDALTRQMNRNFRRESYDHVGPGARKAISNRHAQYLVETQDGE